MAQLPFRILGISHIGIAPKDLGQAQAFFGQLLALEQVGDEDVTSQQTKTSMFASAHATSPHAGADPRLELLAPMAGAGPIAAFLEKRGSGIHHVALQVDSVDRALAYLLEKKTEMIDQSPRPGAHETRIVFVHPRATGGILVELVEEKTRS